ncbi:MAG TPA: hypothetical protein DD391_11930 [Clostridiales bacterium]|nr:hypothetical protein [Clostridiales bacterium]HBL83267.1 hypothetical protein [Clostridiales bacterium]
MFTCFFSCHAALLTLKNRYIYINFTIIYYFTAKRKVFLKKVGKNKIRTENSMRMSNQIYQFTILLAA